MSSPERFATYRNRPRVSLTAMRGEKLVCAGPVRVRVARATITDVVSKSAARATRSAEEKKPEPEEAEPEEKEKADTAAAPSGEAGGRKSMFSFGSKK